MFGSIVQNGKLALCAFPELMQLNNVDFPTFGRPTIPHFNDIIQNFYGNRWQIYEFYGGFSLFEEI